MMFSVEVLTCEKLTEVEKDEIGCDEDDYDSYLRVTHNGKVIALETDRMEPEDVMFYRELSWVPELLEKVYELGVKDGEGK